MLDREPVSPFSLLGELIDRRLEQPATAPTLSADGDVFEREPVPLKVFVEDPGYLNQAPLSPIQYDLLRHVEQVYFPHTYQQLGWETTRYVLELAALWGKGSGKDHIARISAARIAYLLMCLRSPQRYYGMATQDYIEMINVALSAPQAKQFYFDPFVELVKRAPVFRGRAETYEGRIIFDKQIRAISGHSEQEQLEGSNLIYAVLDEFAAFKTKEELEKTARVKFRAPQHSAEALRESLRSSIVSRFPTVGKLLMIAYTRYKGDPITKAAEELQNDPRGYVSGPYATWEVNPRRKEWEFVEEFKKNPESAAAKYKCQPPMAIDAYFKNRDLVLAAFPEGVRENPCIEDGSSPILKPWAKCPHHFACAAHVDLGLRKDRAALAVCHQSGWKTKVVTVLDDKGKPQMMSIKLPVVTLDIVTSFAAPPGGEIDLASVREFLYKLIAFGYQIRLVSYDGFQSAESIQTLQKAGIEAKLRSLDRNRNAYDNLKDLIYDGRLLGGYYRPILVRELLSLTEISGTKIDHPPGGSKDEADAVAGAAEGAIELGVVGCEVSDFWSGGQMLTVARPVGPAGRSVDSVVQSVMPTTSVAALGNIRSMLPMA